MKGRWFRWGVALGSALPGVTLVLRSTDSGRFRQSVSGDNGTFQFLGMAPGNYQIEPELQRFRRDQTTVTLINEAQNIEVSPALTDGRGGFVVPNASAAVYTDMVEIPSFRTLRREVAVGPGSQIAH
jgi:hypothetical protein